MHVFYGKAATWLAELEAGEHAWDSGILWALEGKWQAVLEHLFRQRKLALLARRFGGDVETFEPTDEPQDAWITERDLRRIYAKPPRQVIEQFELRRQEEAARSAAQQQARQAAGRYTVREVADLLAQHAGGKALDWGNRASAAPNDWVGKLVKAICDDKTLTASRLGKDNQYLDYSPERARAWYAALVLASKVNAWLDTNEPGVSYRLPVPQGGSTTSTAGIEPISPQPIAARRQPTSQREQEQVILCALQTLGYDPMNLPRWKNSKAAGAGQNAKQDARSLLKWTSSKVFDLTWERLRHISDRRIKYADES